MPSQRRTASKDCALFILISALGWWSCCSEECSEGQCSECSAFVKTRGTSMLQIGRHESPKYHSTIESAILGRQEIALDAVPSDATKSPKSKQICSEQPPNGRFVSEKDHIIANAAGGNFTDVLEAVAALEVLGHQIDVQDIAVLDPAKAEQVRAGFFAALVEAERASNVTYTMQKMKLKAAMKELVPRKTWLEADASLNTSRNFQWVSMAKQSCTFACQEHALHCDARGMYLSSEREARQAFEASGVNCTQIFEQEHWGLSWDGPFAEGGRCGYIPHDYWIADCNAQCNYARLCPCSDKAGYESVALPASAPTHRLGRFVDVDVTLTLGKELMSKGAGMGGEERATVGHKALSCLSRSCLVYSFGAGYETKYEQHMASLGCRVHIFDCTMTSEPSRLLEYLNQLKAFDNIVFHPWCIGEPPSGGYVTAYGKAIDQFYTLDQVMSKLNHTYVDIVKFDIEGFEWGVIDSLLGSATLPDQIAFELHTSGAYGAAVLPKLVRFKGQYEVNALFLKLMSLGYRIASKEINQADFACAEFVLVRVCGGLQSRSVACD